MTTEVTTRDARNKFSTYLNRAAFGKERIILTRRGERIAALVPIEVLDLLEELEDRYWYEAAAAAEAEAEAKGEKLIPLAEVKKKLGL